ncbi:hypothetical protein XENTR_v10002088 [Xenopus tropicalis]|nr:hypothetical protein XENTR_v10002088 [Xenopus tropicalis]
MPSLMYLLHFPAEPQFDLEPNYQVYMFGDKISLRCCHHSTDFIWQLRFYRAETEIHSAQNSSDVCSVYSFVIQTVQDRGPYQCAIWAGDNGINSEPSRSKSITMNIAEFPEAPVISLRPSYPVYVVGEEINVACLVPSNQEVSGLHLYKEGKEIHPTRKLTDGYIITSGQETTGSYRCAYRKMLNEREIQSRLSSAINITVVDIPPAPFISQNSSHYIFIKGESVTLTCFIPNKYLAYQIEYYKHGIKIHTEETNENDVKHVISTSAQGAAGNYSCTYWTKISGRNMKSLLSNTLEIRITTHPPAPSISLSPSHSVYIVGEHVTLSCYPPDSYKAKGIQYFHEGKEIHSTTHVIYTEVRSSAGNYSCGYWIETHNRNINSMASDYVTIVITNILPPPSISLNPFHSIYIRGETVTLTCSVPDGCVANQIQYYQHGRVVQARLTDERTVMFVISTNNAEVAGNYSCSYTTTKFSRSINSSVSSSVTIIITDKPRPPSIILRPSHPVYLKGEFINMTCSIYNHSIMTKVQFYKDENQIQVEEAHDGEATYRLFLSGLEATGHFLCKYMIIVSGREILSEPSRRIQVTVMDVPNPPSVDLIPAYSVYLKGESVNMTCSAPGNATVKNILYFKDGKVIHTEEAREGKATVLIPDLEIDGKYACKYTTVHSRREIPSQTSSLVRVIDHPRPPSLKLFPEHNIYITEETLTITCYECGNTDEFKLYKNGQILHNSNSKNKILQHKLILQASSNGSYTCTCIKTLSGERRMETKSSNPVDVFVSSPPPAPRLTLAKPVEKTETGFQVTLNCSSAEYPGLARNFSFRRMGEQYNPIQFYKKVTSVSGFLQWEVEDTDNVAFSCSYEGEVNGRIVESERSEILRITLMVSVFSPPLIAGITGGLSFLLCLIVIIFFYMKYKRLSELKRNTWRFSWYWKDRQRNPLKCPVSSFEGTEKVSKNAEASDSLNMKRLSIASVKDEDDMGNNHFNFSTFQSLARESKDHSLDEPCYSLTFM